MRGALDGINCSIFAYGQTHGCQRNVCARGEEGGVMLGVLVLLQKGGTSSYFLENGAALYNHEGVVLFKFLHSNLATEVY